MSASRMWCSLFGHAWRGEGPLYFCGRCAALRFVHGRQVLSDFMEKFERAVNEALKDLQTKQ